MSSSVSISIATNTAIAAAKGFGWAVTGSPTLFAETIHSVADVANQVLLKVGELRGRPGPDALHPFGRGQEKFFWALVSAVSVFFIGCGLNVYHGAHALLSPSVIEPFTPLVLGLLLFALALESFTFGIALRELGGWKSIARNRNNTTVLAVLLEDAVALLGILLTLIVVGVSFLWGPHRRGCAARRDGAFSGRHQPAPAHRQLRSGTRSRRRPLPGRKGIAGEGELDRGRRRSQRTVRARSASRRARTCDRISCAGRGVLAHEGKTVDAVYWQFPIAETYIEIEAANLMRFHAASLFDAGKPCGAEANMAKLLAAKASWEAANVCLQTHGGFGFACEFDVERKFRETRLYQVAPVSTNMIFSYVAEHVLGLPRSF